MVDAHENDQAREPSKYHIRLLADTPAESDEFDAKAHERVADAIAELVATEPGGKVVGLEGLWGSGKSTVVRLVRERLKAGGVGNGDATRVVVFDAWAHEGDPLRRTFLETLIRELATARWLDQATADAATNDLTGRTSQVTSKVTSRLSLEGKLAAGAAVLLVLGGALFGNDFSQYHRPALALGTILLVAPLLVVLGLWLARSLGKKMCEGGRGGKWKTLAALQPSSFFANDQSTTTVAEGVQQGEPTSVEFERIFSSVLTTALTDSRRLLIVLDNLDRVEESGARKVLATMQTFTASTHAPADWTPRVWTLIPYDAFGLERLWAGSTDQAASGPTLAAAFLDKLFQVRFEAPPLVLSDWRSYVMHLLGEAFPDEDEENLRAVLRLRGLYPGAVPERTVAAESPTPRQLKQFINQIGAVRRQRDDISLVHIGYFVLLRRDGIDLPKELIGGNIPHAKLAHVFDAGVREDIAALHFGADRHLAQQLLLGPALEDAFSRGEASLVEGLRERTGFVDALERLDLDARAAGGGVDLTRAVAVLAQSGALGVESVNAWAGATLDPLADKTLIWHVQGRDSGTGLAILLNRISPGDDGRLGQLLSRLAPSPVEADTEGTGQLDGIAGLVDELTNLGRVSDDVRVTIDIPLARSVESLSYLQTQTEQPKSARMVEFAASPSELAGALVEAAALSRVTDARSSLELLLLRAERVSLEDVAAGSLSWLRANEPTDQDQLGLFLEWLDRARLALDAESILGAGADDGTLMHLVAVGVTNGWYAEAATASMLHLVVRPELPDPPEQSRLSPNGLGVVREALSGGTPAELVAGQLDWLTDHKREAFVLIAKMSKGSAAAWIDQQMRALSDAYALVTSTAQFLANSSYLRRVLGEERFLRHTRLLLDKDTNRERILAALTEPALALDVLAATDGEEKASYVREAESAAAAVVRSASADDWKGALMSVETQPLVSLAVRISATKATATNPTGLQEALHAHFQALAADEDGWRTDGATFASLTRLLNPSARRVLASQLCAELEGRDGQVGAELFPTYGEFLRGESAFRSHSKLPNVIERFVARDQWPIVAWFVDLMKHEIDAVDEAGREAEMQHLKQSVAGRLSSFGDEAPEELKQLGVTLGGPPSPEVSES